MFLVRRAPSRSASDGRPRHWTACGPRIASADAHSGTPYIVPGTHSTSVGYDYAGALAGSMDFMLSRIVFSFPLLGTGVLPSHVMPRSHSRKYRDK